jgi:hypothetical protein
MSVQINPALLATKKSSEVYMNRKVASIESKKMSGDSSPDFTAFLKDLTDQYITSNNDDTDIDTTDLISKDITRDHATTLHSDLVSNGYINNAKDGLINLTINTDTIASYLSHRLSELGTPQPEHAAQTLVQQSSNKKTNIGAFTKQLFYVESLIPSPLSTDIWHQLHRNDILDDYGVLWKTPTDAGVSQSLSGLNLTNNQHDYVIGLLSQFRGLTYLEYKKTWEKEAKAPKKSSHAPGFYIPKELRKSTPPTPERLSREELEEIRKVALLEWTIILGTQRNNHKTSIKRTDKRKKEALELEMEVQQEIQKDHAKQVAESKRRDQQARMAAMAKNKAKK